MYILYKVQCSEKGLFKDKPFESPIIIYFVELFCEVGIVEQLVGLLHEEHKLHHEHFLRALAKLAEDNPFAVRECRRTEFSLEQLLREKTKQLAGKEEYKVMFVNV